MNRSKRFVLRIRMRALCLALLLLILSAVPVSASASTKYIKTTSGSVNVRKAASTSADTLGQLSKGAVLKSSGSTTKNDVKWYKVSYKGNTGYVMAKYCKSSTESEYNYYVNKGSSSSSSSKSSSSTSSVSKGTLALTKKNKVILRGSASSKGSQVSLIYKKETLVTLQGKKTKADGYTWYSVKVDGKTGWIRGDLIRILSSKEASAYKSSHTGEKALNPIEKVDWNKSNISKIFYKGCVATLTDVKTGISFKIKRWSGARHADVEPLTASDTAKMCKIYGVKKAQEINDKNLYQRRAILITVAGHTYAASMYGVPHNYPAGDTIANNKFNGQFCVHFVNSSTHGSKKVDSGHQKAIKYAYKYGESILKQYGYSFD